MTRIAATFEVEQEGDFARLIHHLGNMDHPFTAVVSPGLKPKKRTDAMNRTIHKWFGEIASHRGDVTKLEVKAECNLTYGVPIKRRDSNEWGAVFGYLFDSLNYPAKVKALRLLDIPVTRDMTVKQLIEYMDQMQRDYRGQGVVLTDPDARKYEGEFA